jgi:hypothetical protein
LSSAALARDRGIDTVVLGQPMVFWREKMPEGMFLRSGPDWHSTPAASTLEGGERLVADAVVCAPGIRHYTHFPTGPLVSLPTGRFTPAILCGSTSWRVHAC